MRFILRQMDYLKSIHTINNYMDRYKNEDTLTEVLCAVAQGHSKHSAMGTLVSPRDSSGRLLELKIWDIERLLPQKKKKKIR